MLKSSIITRIKHFGLKDCRDPRFPIRSFIFHKEKGGGEPSPWRHKLEEGSRLGKESRGSSRYFGF